MYKIGAFSYTTLWLNYLINCCIIKSLGFVSFPNSTIRLSNSDLTVYNHSQRLSRLSRQSIDTIIVTIVVMVTDQLDLLRSHSPPFPASCCCVLDVHFLLWPFCVFFGN